MSSEGILSRAACAKIILFNAAEGRSAEYSEYLHSSVEPIDQQAVREGALLDMLTLVNDAGTASAHQQPWTHLRIFLFESEAQRDAIKTVFARIAPALQPDEASRKARKAYGESLRSLVAELDVGVLG